MLSKAFRKAGELAAATAKASARRNQLSSGGGVPAETADAVVIGAGVVGLAVARELALKGRDVLVVEAASTFGTGTSSRNSEVIHAGIYYPYQSLKAVLCLRGKELLYKYCSDRDIPHKQLGKLIVATRASEISKLEQILKRGIENGVEDLRMTEGSVAMKMEPELHCVKALLSPSSGIVDSHALMLSLVGEAENLGATISYNTVVIGGQVEENSLHLQISESKDLESHAGESTFQPQLVIIPKIVINSAGLSAIHLAKRFQGLEHRFIPAPYFARGCYFTLSNTKSPFSRLIYPIPEDGGLGVHVTLDLNGQVKFGPDVEWIDDVDDISSCLNRLTYGVMSDRRDFVYRRRGDRNSVRNNHPRPISVPALTTSSYPGRVVTDNLLMEESAQILEIETFIPMLVQRQEDGHARLKRCILIGDHHHLPPVVKNMAFQKYNHMDQSLFTRFVRLGIPYIELNAQGRARPSLAKLYNWRYRDLGDLPFVHEEPIFNKANSGFSYEYQLIDVPDYLGKGETAPSPWFYQNEGEAEYIVSVYMYMRLLGYPASKISILTTYNGHKLLIRDVISRRCTACGIGPPSKVATVDKFQGQQNDFILLSLVRTRFVGHLRDLRRLVVAMLQARLGLYVFCRRSLFEQCYELQPTFQLLLRRPDHLSLNLDEVTPFTERPVGETGRIHFVSGIQEMDGLVNFKMHQFYQVQVMGGQHAASQAPVSHPNGATKSLSRDVVDDMPLASSGDETGSHPNGIRESSSEEVKGSDMALASGENGNVAQGDGLAEEDKMEE